MVTGWTVLLTFLVIFYLGCCAEDTEEKNDNQAEGKEVHQPWLGSLLGLTRRDLRHVLGNKREEKC
jgi:hypothetical protein